MTVADAQLAFPFILLAIGIIAVLGPSFPTLIVVIGLSGWVTYSFAKTIFRESPSGLSFAGDFDQRHTVSAYGSYRFTGTFNVSGKTVVRLSAAYNLEAFDKNGWVVVRKTPTNSFRPTQVVLTAS